MKASLANSDIPYWEAICHFKASPAVEKAIAFAQPRFAEAPLLAQAELCIEFWRIVYREPDYEMSQADSIGFLFCAESEGDEDNIPRNLARHADARGIPQADIAKALRSVAKLCYKSPLLPEDHKLLKEVAGGYYEISAQQFIDEAIVSDLDAWRESEGMPVPKREGPFHTIPAGR